MIKMRRISLTIVLTLLSVCFIGTVNAAEECGQVQGNPIADEMIGSSGITWMPKISYAQLRLTVSRPNGTIFSKTFAGGSNPYLDFSGIYGDNSGDGSYTYELRAFPGVGNKVRNVEGVSGINQATRPRRAMVQTGHFLIQGGAIVQQGAPEGLDRTKDVLHYDDVIITGSLCIGYDCVDGESFGYCTLKLKENNLQICFEDTSTGTFPTRDWKIQTNDSASGGASYFTIWDTDGGVRPFTIEAGAPAHSLYVEDYGRVGLGTSVPVLDLHIVSGDSPAIRLDQDTSSGWTAQVWDIAGNEANFFVRDTTGGSKLPFRIQPGTPTNTLTLKSDGKVGIGTWSPEAQFEIEKTGENAAVIFQRTDGATGKFTARPSEVYLGSGSDHNVQMVANNNVIMTIEPGGDVGIGNTNPGYLLAVGGSGAYCDGGNWIDGSSRNYKENIKDLAASDAMETLKRLNPVRFNYKGDKSEESLGFIAEDVPELVATKDRKGMSPMDVVAILTKVVQEQQKTISKLEQKIAELEKK